MKKLHYFEAEGKVNAQMAGEDSVISVASESKERFNVERLVACGYMERLLHDRIGRNPGERTPPFQESILRGFCLRNFISVFDHCARSEQSPEHELDKV